MVPRVDAASRVGTTVDRDWTITALIGRGGMASVYAATHSDGRRAAFTILHAEHAADADLRDRFLRERWVAQKIIHPGAVRMLGSGITDDGSLMLIMELLEGETLEAASRRERIPVRQVLRIAERLLDFLECCHAHGVVHRDLKPSNVFLTNDGEVKVIDFGVARARAGRRTDRRMAIGTPSFMSPEQARGTSEQVDGRADVFALGAMLFSLVSGMSLRTGRDDDETLGIAAREAPRSVYLVAPDLPREVARVIDKALAWDPRDRWNDAAEMRAELTRILVAWAERDGEDTGLGVPPPGHVRPTIPETPASIRTSDGESRSTVPELFVRSPIVHYELDLTAASESSGAPAPSK